MGRYWRAALLYVLLFIPLAASLAFMEGAARGLWAMTASEWIFQGGAFLAYFGGLLLLIGILAVPVLLGLVTKCINRSRSVGLLLASMVAPVMILLVPTALLVLLEVLTAGPWRRGLVLTEFPFGYGLASAAYGAALVLILSRQRYQPAV